MKTYTELVKRTELLSRFRYLRLGGELGLATFGHERELNQRFYQSTEWKRIRDFCIVRDLGCDMGLSDYSIMDKIFVHHMNPLTPKDIVFANPDNLNPEYLICVSHTTHTAIHYGDENLLPRPLVERKPGDQIGWKRKW